MRTVILTAALLLAAPLPGIAAAKESDLPVRSGQAGVNLEWPQPPQAVRYRVDDLMLTMRNDVDPADQSLLHRSLRIDAPGFAPFTIDPGENDTYPPAVMVVEAGSDRPLVLFQTYSGGAHCCTTMTAIMPRDGRLEGVEVYSGDGASIDTPPSDVNGDGRVDFVFPDNAFYYAFSSYAESLAPTRVVNVIDGEAVDVSDRPDLRPVYEREFGIARHDCVVEEGGNPNGVCAAYAAIAARLGRFDSAWPEVLRAYSREIDWPMPTGCQPTIAENETCPDAEQIEYKDYPEALRHFLIEQGYIEE